MTQHQLLLDDKTIIPISNEALVQSNLLKNLIKDIKFEGPIPLPKIDKPTALAITNFLEQSLSLHEDKWQQKFIYENAKLLPKLIVASQYLQITSLNEQINVFIADQISNCGTTQEMNETLGIFNDLSQQQSQLIDETLKVLIP